MTVKIGTQFRSVYADSNALWTVVGNRSGDVWDCKIDKKNVDYVGTKGVFTTAQIEAALTQDKFWDRVGRANEIWWDSRKVGEIVHYHNGFGQYVRGEIVVYQRQFQMLPKALVGDWREYDLPRRAADGSINYSYHAQKIMDQEPMRPNASNMFECEMFSRKGRPDPTQMAPISLAVPSMDEITAAKAKLEKARFDVISLLQEGHKDPKASLIAAKALIEEILA